MQTLAAIAALALTFAPVARHGVRPTRGPVRAGVRLEAPLDMPLEPRDDLKVGFSRGADDGPIRSFASVKPVEEVRAPDPASVNEQLRAEIEALMPTEKPAPPENKPVDLNGIKPRDLLIGAGTYAIVCFLAVQFTQASANFFNEHPPRETDFYFVQRFTGLARVVVVACGALGAGVTGIASAGQALLAVQVALGIAKGELDPNAERVLANPEKKLEIEKMFSMMSGARWSPLLACSHPLLLPTPRLRLPCLAIRIRRRQDALRRASTAHERMRSRPACPVARGGMA